MPNDRRNVLPYFGPAPSDPNAPESAVEKFLGSLIPFVFIAFWAATGVGFFLMVIFAILHLLL